MQTETEACETASISTKTRVQELEKSGIGFYHTCSTTLWTQFQKITVEEVLGHD